MIAKKLPDAPVVEPQRKETSRIWVYFQSHCSSCEWVAADRRQMESDSWSDLTSHMRTAHGGNCREVRVKRTVVEEVIEEQE